MGLFGGGGTGPSDDRDSWAGGRRRSSDKDFDFRPVEETPGQARASRNIVPIRVKKGVPTRVKRWIILGVPVVFLLLVVSTAIQSNKARDSVDRAEVLYSSAYNPSFKVRYDDLGKQVVTNWYGQNEPVVDVASGVRWPGSASTASGVVESTDDKSTAPAQSTNIIPDIKHVVFLEGKQSSATIDSKITEKYPNYKNPYEELLKYYVVINNQALTVSITLVIPDIDDTSLTPILMAPPSILAADMVGNSRSEVSSNPVGVPGIAQVEASSQLQSTVRLWADAWASNNSNALRITAQDPDNRSYFGLGGWTADEKSVRVNWAYSPTKDGSTSKGRIDDPNVMLVEVEFVMYQKPTNTESKSSEINQKTQFSNVQIMNLMIKGATTNSPSVVAWGPSGSWAELEPYSNGISQDELNSVQKSGAEGNASGTVNGSGQGGTSSNSSPSTSSKPSSTSSPSSTESPTTTTSSPTTDGQAEGN